MYCPTQIFEKRLGNLLNQFEIDREQRRNAGVNSERPAPDSETEKTAETQPPPIVNKGKVREFRDTGIPGIDNADLDPEAQRRAWENFDFLKKEDPERNNGTKAGTPGADRAGPSNSSPPKKGMRVEIVEELYGEDDVSDKQSSPTPAGLETNPVPSETLDTSEISLPMGDKNPKTERNANFEPPVTSTPTYRGANRSGGSGSSSLPLSHAGTSGDNRGRSPMSGLIRPGNPHIDLQNMINVSRNAMYSGKGKDNPNVRTGPAFAADQVAPNSYLRTILAIPALTSPLPLHPRMNRVGLGMSLIEMERERNAKRKRVRAVPTPMNDLHGISAFLLPRMMDRMIRRKWQDSSRSANST